MGGTVTGRRDSRQGMGDPDVTRINPWVTVLIACAVGAGCWYLAWRLVMWTISEWAHLIGNL